ncbi:unnamed protein product [Rotaria sordida]|uniref:MULE transposase domain-containing protein n=1 Tax=Rotaria sordida TaxID=392033 RepID=A0A818XSH1_9BILA|nr:unnamed protein product [Rotaria sordida]
MMTAPSNRISFIISQKGKKMLNINNFIFKLNKITSTTKYYRCEDSCCTVTARTDLEDNILNIKGDHCHPPEPEEIQIRVFKQVVKARAISENTPIPQIYDEEAARINLSTLAIAALPSQGELVYFAAFVCVFALLSDRKKPTYKYLFHELRNKAAQLNMTFNPYTIMSDFEGTVAEILKIEFPNSQHVGCFFHYTQSIYRNFQQLGLSSQYAADDEIRNTCRKLMALALMPISLVLQAYDDLHGSVLESSSTTFDSLKPLFSYFENQWIKNVDIQRWNVYGLHMRTNNNAEGYHNRLNLRISKYHPNIWAFIRCIQGEENRFNHLLIQMKGGLTARPKTKKTLAIQHRIDTLYIRYDNGYINANELLNGLSYVVAKNIKSKRK